MVSSKSQWQDWLVVAAANHGDWAGCSSSRIIAGAGHPECARYQAASAGEGGSLYACVHNSLLPPTHPPAADVKNKRGQHARGKKVTGMAFLPADPGKLLITSNDSRVR